MRGNRVHVLIRVTIFSLQAVHITFCVSTGIFSTLNSFNGTTVVNPNVLVTQWKRTQKKTEGVINCS